MDNIIIDKIWIDEQFYELRLSFESKKINCNINLYMQDDTILQLQREIETYLNNPHTCKLLWKVEGEDSKEVIIASKNFDSRGHLALDIKVRGKTCYDNISIDEDILDDFACNFSIETELGLLQEFGIKLKKLCDGKICTRISLY